MANYSLIINSRFSPFSYQEMLAPVLMATQAHQELENQYGELATKASVWEEMANEQTDPNAYKMYKTYADDLEKQAGQLAREGLNATSRRDMLNMRTRYAKEITPIEQAYNTRQRQAEQQQQALLQNPTLMLSRRAATTSLDKYIENPNLGYESYSGALLTQQVGQAAAAIAKELRNYGKGKPLDGFTRTWLQQHGYTAGEVALAINNPNDPKSSKVLNTIVNNVIADSGIPNWADNKTLNQAYSYARQGLWQAVGQTQVGSYTDQAAVMRAQEAMQRRAEARARRAARGAAREAARKLLDFTPRFDRRNPKTSQDISKISAEATEWNKFKKYFYRTKNNNIAMTAKGRKQELTDYEVFTYPNGNISKRKVDSEFGAFIKKYGLMDMYKGYVGPKQTARLEAMFHRIENTYDANVATEYVKRVDPSQYDNVIAALNTNANNGVIINYNRVKKGNSYGFSRGDEVKVGELTNTDIKSASGIYGEHGIYLEVKLKDGTTLDIPLSSYSPNYNNLMLGNSETIKGYRRMLRDGKKYYQMPDGNFYPINDLIIAELNNMGDNFMSSLGTFQTESGQVERGEYATQVY